jgi:magnesium chelatase family protein
MNPCPCGEAGEPGRCRCSDGALARYHRRLSGPLLDRFDLRIDVVRAEPEQLLGGEAGECTATVAERVARARARAAARGVVANAHLRGPALGRSAPLARSAASLLSAALESGRLTARGLDRVRRVALTIADLDAHEGPLNDVHVASALALRADVRLGSGVVA